MIGRAARLTQSISRQITPRRKQAVMMQTVQQQQLQQQQKPVLVPQRTNLESCKQHIVIAKSQGTYSAPRSLCQSKTQLM